MVSEITAEKPKEDVSDDEGPVKIYPFDEYPKTIDPETKKTVMVVQVQSAGYKGGNFAKITINDLPVEILGDNNQNPSQWGLHVVLINNTNGIVEAAKSFDTYEHSRVINAFITNDIPDGWIVCAACKDECIMNLSKKAKDWLVKMGSKEIYQTRQGCGFAFIGVYNYLGYIKDPPIEKRAQTQEESVSVTQVFHIDPGTLERGGALWFIWITYCLMSWTYVFIFWKFKYIYSILDNYDDLLLQ